MTSNHDSNYIIASALMAVIMLSESASCQLYDRHADSCGYFVMLDSSFCASWRPLTSSSRGLLVLHFVWPFTFSFLDY